MKSYVLGALIAATMAIGTAKAAHANLPIDHHLGSIVLSSGRAVAKDSALRGPADEDAFQRELTRMVKVSWSTNSNHWELASAAGRSGCWR